MGCNAKSAISITPMPLPSPRSPRGLPPGVWATLPPTLRISGSLGSAAAEVLPSVQPCRLKSGDSPVNQLIGCGFEPRRPRMNKPLSPPHRPRSQGFVSFCAQFRPILSSTKRRFLRHAHRYFFECNWKQRTGMHFHLLSLAGARYRAACSVRQLD